MASRPIIAMCSQGTQQWAEISARSTNQSINYLFVHQLVENQHTDVTEIFASCGTTFHSHITGVLEVSTTISNTQGLYFKARNTRLVFWHNNNFFPTSFE